MKATILSVMFGKYVSKEKLRNLPEVTSRIEDRILAVLTGVGVHRYSGATADIANDLANMGWIVETIHPLILASRPIDVEGREECKKVIEYCSLQK